MAKQAGVSEAVKGTVLSAFFWGYAVSQARASTMYAVRSTGSLLVSSGQGQEYHHARCILAFS